MGLFYVFCFVCCLLEAGFFPMRDRKGTGCEGRWGGTGGVEGGETLIRRY